MKEIKPKVNTDVVEMLERLLNEAKSGEIQAVAVVGAMRGARLFNCFVVGDHVIPLLGENRILERDMIDCCVDTRISVAPEE